MKFNVWSVVSMLFFIYIGNSLWHLYSLYFPALCKSADKTKCLNPALAKTDDLQLRLYYSLYGRTVDFEKNEIYRKQNFDTAKELSETFDVMLPEKTRKNGTLWIHAFLLPSKFENEEDPRRSSWFLERKSLVTFYTIPMAETINLMGKDEFSKNGKKTPATSSDQKVVSHWRSVLPLTGVGDSLSFDWDNVPGEIAHLLQLNNERRYLPIFYLDELSYRVRDLIQIKESSNKINLTLKYQPVSVGKLRLLITAYHSTESLKSLGFTEKDIDEVKGIFTDTNFYFLALTFFVAAVHLLLDFLAFKNDINFWRGRKTMVGLSTKALLWRCFSQVVVFFYLMDENTSLLVLIPAAIGALIELWKLTKAFKVRLVFKSRFVPTLTFGGTSKEEQETAAFDSQGMTYLAYVLIPLCLGGAVYSLFYIPHKSWYSWFIQSLANAVYAFGFLFMLPQLFINYKLKSVAHLPWRAFMYKAFNTFIDDMFAFIISMPTSHRVACFRDDVVFLVYLYQRYLYPVDKSRVNEFGESFEQEEIDEQKKTK